MSTTVLRVALCLATCLILGASVARAEVITMDGTGEGLPEGYKYELSVLAIRQQEGIVIEVVGKSCTGSPGAVVDPRSCQRTTVVFTIPAGLSVVGREVRY